MFSYKSPFCHLGTHQSLLGNLLSRPTIVPKQTFEAISDRGSEIIRLKLMLQHSSHRGKHVAMSHSIQFLPLVKLALNGSRGISWWHGRARSGENIYCWDCSLKPMSLCIRYRNNYLYLWKSTLHIIMYVCVL